NDKSMANTKKHKADFENHQFKSDWTDCFCFILPDHAKAKPTCLICMQTVVVCKTDNLKRHFNTMHAASFNANYPPESDQRKQKIANMITSFKHSVSTISKSTSAQESATAASLQISWYLAKANKPFADAELMKSCAVAMVSEVLRHDEKQKKTVVELLQQVPLSANTATRRVEVLGTAFCFFAVSSSSDWAHNRGSHLYRTDSILCEEWLGCWQIVSIVTDGAPSVVEQHKGLVSRLSAINPALLAFHCIIHKSVLCAKLCGKMQETMDTVTRLVNFVHENSSLQHRLFRAMLDEISAEHKDLLLHNDVRWLSKGRVLERVCDLRDELASFLSTLQSQRAQEFKIFLIDNDMMGYVFFLCDIMSHLNCLNLQLQGKNHTVVDMYKAVEAFRSKVKLLEKDIQGRKLHFPRLREHCEKNNMGEDQVMQDFVSSLAKNFYECFECTPKLSSDILLFLRQPFSVSADGQWTAEAKKVWPSIDEAALQMEVLEMGTSDVLKAQHRDVGVKDFWINMVPQARFKNTRGIAMLLLTMFPSTYICESSFSSMNSIKNQDRNRLSNAHLDQCLRIATTEYRPDIRNLENLLKI
uniref:HAT C-terminal dimerisation domain-containing protein n=1 Tax=Amphiprion ocellaris TaxID=80972 RepID=A0A3Q1BMH2_AMPOC